AAYRRRGRDAAASHRARPDPWRGEGLGRGSWGDVQDPLRDQTHEGRTMTHHHLPATPETVRWGHWDGSLPPALTVKSGDTVTVDTVSGEPADLPDAASGFKVLPDHSEVLAAPYVGPGPHLLTGPIAVEGAKAGDVLEVRIKDIKLRQDWGWNLQ